MGDNVDPEELRANLKEYDDQLKQVGFYFAFQPLLHNQEELTHYWYMNAGGTATRRRPRQ